MGRDALCSREKTVLANNFRIYTAQTYNAKLQKSKTLGR
jgi:hypothetical protein